MNETETTARRRRWYQRRWLWWLAGTAVVLFCVFLAAVQYVAKNTEPVLRKKIIESMSKRFHAPVELDAIHISTLKGLQVTGEGLRVQYTAGTPDASATSDTDTENSEQGVSAPHQPKQMINIKRFEFRTDLWALLHRSASVGVVRVEGMELHIPPKGDRGTLLGKKDETQLKDPNKKRIPLLLSHVICDNAVLFIETDKPGKVPLEFDIQHVELTDIGVDKPFHYDAQLINPKPTGQIHAVGTFGPWHSDEPRDTPIEGDYDFSHADLNSIHGIGGMLSSTGHFNGLLGHITVDGETDTPNFSIDTANRPVPLHTEFHAIVDGTNGDTFLDPVKARLRNSYFTARGVVKKVSADGHDIYLDVDMPHARIEDMLDLAVSTRPALMTGALTMKTKLHIPPGSARVAQKLALNGTFHITKVSFSNTHVQDRIDGLSMRAQGHPKDAAEAGNDKAAEVASDMKAHFDLGNSMMTITDLNYQIPGALVKLNGVYSLSGEVFEFKGHVRTDARASQMVTGWKSWLLKPVDPFLAKHGAGLELPISISGTKSEPHFGLALKHGDDTIEQMKQDLKDKVPAKSTRKDAHADNSEAKRQAEEEKREKKEEKRERKQEEKREKDAQKAAAPQR